MRPELLPQIGAEPRREQAGAAVHGLTESRLATVELGPHAGEVIADAREQQSEAGLPLRGAGAAPPQPSGPGQRAMAQWCARWR